MKEIYIACAAGLGMGDFTKVKTGQARSALITKLADMYCDATDAGEQLKRSQAISALMLLFWGEIGKMADKCKAVSDYGYGDFATQLYICIETAMSYRAWRSGSCNAEQCIRAAIGSRGAATVLVETNRDRYRANVNAMSLDAPADSESDAAFIDSLEDESTASERAAFAVREMAQRLIDSGDLVGSIMVDGAAFMDSTVETRESKTCVRYDEGEDGNIVESECSYTSYATKFSENAMVKSLMEALCDPSGYKRSFMRRYSVSEGALDAAIAALSKADSTKLHKFAKKTWEGLRASLSR